MRKGLPIAAVVLLAACGGERPVHYDVRSALECLQRTNSTRGGGDDRSVLLLFASDDGISAVEPVFVAFGDGSPKGPVATALGVSANDPTWEEHRGDARVAGYGPYAPPVAKARGITDEQAKQAADALGPAVRSAIDACLERNER